MKLHIFDKPEELSEHLAIWMVSVIKESLKTQEFFTLVLSGGDTPKKLFKKLASEEFRNQINWKRIHIFWADERVVPFSDDRNNAKTAFDLLIDHIDVPKAQIHMMRTDIEPNFAADEYAKLLHTFFDHTPQSFDLVLLGMGDDGHTLSLFPDSPIIEEHNNWVNAVYNKKQQMYRITLMPLIVNRAVKIAFMVEGEKKAKVLREVLEGDYTPAKLPVQIINPIEGELHWFLDEAAAKKLHSP